MCTVSEAGQSPVTGLAAPENLVAVASPRRIKLKWKAGVNSVRPAAYRVYRDGVLLGVNKKTSRLDKSVSPDGLYFYYVTAVDAAGNESPASNVAAVSASVVVKN
jgi:fibronectin type 3 domain-containing protein